MNELNIIFAQQIAQQFEKTNEEVQQLFNSCGTSHEEFFKLFQENSSKNWKSFQQATVDLFLSKRIHFSIPSGPIEKESISGLLWL